MAVKSFFSRRLINYLEFNIRQKDFVGTFSSQISKKYGDDTQAEFDSEQSFY